MNLKNLESKLNHDFDDIKLLERAITRKDYCTKKKQAKRPVPKHQKDLATLGDAIFKLIVIEELMDEGVETPGSITEGKSKIECRSKLAEFAKPFSLEKYMYSTETVAIKKGVSAQGETLEAIIGAIHIDAGYCVCKKVVLSWPEIDRVISKIAYEIMQKE